MLNYLMLNIHQAFKWVVRISRVGMLSPLRAKVHVGIVHPVALQALGTGPGV